MKDITKTTSSESVGDISFEEDVLTRMGSAADSLFTTSKEKYHEKAKLIEEAEDLSTQEKLDALDSNYDRHNREVWQGILSLAACGVAVWGIVTFGPSIAKGARGIIRVAA
jgi:hypothetical protein